MPPSRRRRERATSRLGPDWRPPAGVRSGARAPRSSRLLPPFLLLPAQRWPWSRRGAVNGAAGAGTEGRGSRTRGGRGRHGGRFGGGMLDPPEGGARRGTGQGPRPASTPDQRRRRRQRGARTVGGRGLATEGTMPRPGRIPMGSDVGGSVRRHGGGGRTRPDARRSGPDRAAALMLLLRRRNASRPPIRGVEGGGHRIRRMAGKTAAGSSRFWWRVDAKLGRGGIRRMSYCGCEEGASFALEAANRGRLTRSAVGPGSGPIPWVHFPYCSNQTHEIQTKKFFPSSQPNTEASSLGCV